MKALCSVHFGAVSLKFDFGYKNPFILAKLETRGIGRPLPVKK